LRYTIGVLPISWDALSLIFVPGKTPGSAAACCCWVENKDAAPARGAAARACCWRSDRFRINLIIILSISLALTADVLGVGLIAAK
jgi:hypothetical protein